MPKPIFHYLPLTDLAGPTLCGRKVTPELSYTTTIRRVTCMACRERYRQQRQATRKGPKAEGANHVRRPSN